ncbi:hypothetical protein [Sinisalibacter lacisalsi]|uniref:Uncharacterized protein n=1 Tax=Sinisalibacter lacisalsi TaxID=1526570 RepID=A0ABQ1QRC7_9RHOB|nr:hypothetical protein [Sinisalibacter lacisalsi]GGD42123.1 hypothetical protein GCM10011358_27500 [Sinisalibacter lacisalsi]
MGRDKRNEAKGEHFTKMVRTTMESEAWRALSPTAQALYPWLKLEWSGPNSNNNGKIRLSVRQAAQRLGVGINAAARAFHALQAKGFIVVAEHASLGVEGHATSPAYELTEIGLAHTDKLGGRRLYRDWKPGADFPVHKAVVHNPEGGRKKKNPVLRLVTTRHQNGDA